MTGAWVLAARPATLGAAVVPVAVGTAVAAASGGARLELAAAALAGALLIQIGTNLANDVHDHERGADSAERLGPTRAVQAGLLTPAAVRRGMVLAFALASAAGVYLAAAAGPWVLVIGIASILSGLAYTAGPLPLAYVGLGDLFVYVFFGHVAVGGTAYVQLGMVPAIAYAAAVPIGALATAILVVNNLRDRTTDAQARKRTLAVRFGRRAAIGEYVALLSAAYLAPVLLGPRTGWALLPLLTLPEAVRLGLRVGGAEGRALNPLLGQTARLLVGYGLLHAVGIALGGGGRSS